MCIRDRHVTEFLDAFMLGPNIKVVKSLLPDVLPGVVKQGSLCRIASTLRLYQDASCKSELKRLHYGRGILLLRFADQQVNVLGHDHVTDDDELVALAHPLQHGQKHAATARRGEKRLSPITTAGDEMQVSSTVVAF